MIAPLTTLLLSAAAGTYAAPLWDLAHPIRPRTVTQLDQQAFEEAQQRDDTATRAFSSVPITTSDGQCLFVDLLSGDFRANLNPIQVGSCDGSTGQLWDAITAGKHNNVAGSMLVVNTLTQACMNFDPRRAAGNQAIMFSCGGRADGGGQVTTSQLFPTANGTEFTLSPENQAGTCFTVKGNVIDVANCDSSDANQSFTFGASGTSSSSGSSTDSAPSEVSSAAGDVDAVASAAPSACAEQPTPTVTVTVTGDVAAATSAAAAADPVDSAPTDVAPTDVAAPTSEAAASTAAASQAAVVTDAPSVAGIPDFNPTTPVSVSRAGGVLQPSAVAESQQFDATATRPITGVSLKASNGQCLFIDPTAGDFRENLIPIALQDCTGSPNEKFDFITQGKHNNAQNSTLIVSTLMNGCVNFDPRRAAGDTVIMFSCGGRADGDSQTTNSQLFPFNIDENSNSILLAPENGNGQTCLVPINGKLDSTNCDGSADQEFTIVH
ncbi:hypothetical protein F5884DRAFT_475665 [Xylogone sp. PMI_703]|nr:hypothetical protein F5884DRAFT_475665 [Xylogone sp. PMI_703]